MKDGERLVFQPLRLTVVPEAAQVTLGGQVTLHLTVRNDSGEDARYRFAVSGIPTDWYDLDQLSVCPPPAASAQVLLTAHPPAGAGATAGRYAITVQVTAEDDPAIHTSTVVPLMVS